MIFHTNLYQPKDETISDHFLNLFQVQNSNTKKKFMIYCIWRAVSFATLLLQFAAEAIYFIYWRLLNCNSQQLKLKAGNI